VKAGARLDFETNPLLNVTVNVNDPTVGGPVDASRSLAIKIGNMAENLTATRGNDTLIGTNNGETISGLGGNDRIVANGGNDILIGGLGADRLTGGLGRDVFDFNSINDSAPRQSGMVNNASFSPIAGQGLRDIITDFTRGQDKIDLSTIDVNTNVGGNQAFVWRGTGSFTGAPGQLIERHFNPAGTANDKTIIYGDINGDHRADFQIELTGIRLLAASDFIV